MKKRYLLAAAAAALCAVTATGCGSSSAKETTAAAETTTAAATEEATEAATEAETAQIANPWTESDEEGVAAATGFDMKAPEGATEISYSYMAEGGMAQMKYQLDGADWTYRMQLTDALTDISGMNYDWGSEDEGTVSGRKAMYYGIGGPEDTENVQLVNWYDAVTGVTYSLSASGTDLNGMDIQAYAESIFTPLQGDATDDPEADRRDELDNYFLGTHKRSEDGSELSIKENSDGSFSVDLSIVGLCSLEDGTGTFEDHKLFFEIEDPSENKLSAMIYRDSDNSLDVKITDSTWEYLPNDEVLTGFGK